MRPIILVSGLSLSIGCASHEEPTTTASPPPGPAPAPAPEVVEPAPGPPGVPPLPPRPPTSNPPPPQPIPLPNDALPSWDDVTSQHPAGATNPPVPVLAISADGAQCYKEWRDPRAVPRDAILSGGRIIADDEEVQGTQIACPAERVQKVLDANKAAEDGDGAPR